jgi:chemotaxis protein methyltransferase CheR
LAKKNGHENYIDLLKHLIFNPLNSIHMECFEAMTTNETMFFRDVYPFEVLKNNIVPSIMDQKKSSKEFYVWCAAASTGQEPYSLVILLKENFPELNNWNVYIKATDLSSEAIEKAKSGIYNTAEIQRGLTQAQIDRYFTKLPNGHFKLNEDIKKNVKFDCMNLVDDWPFLPRFDLILLRNIMIYFNQNTKLDILKKMNHQLLGTGSVLMLGSSESILYDETFQLVQLDRASYYLKK